jgi:hypothetical protein
MKLNKNQKIGIVFILSLVLVFLFYFAPNIKLFGPVGGDTWFFYTLMEQVSQEESVFIHNPYISEAFNDYPIGMPVHLVTVSNITGLGNAFVIKWWPTGFIVMFSAVVFVLLRNLKFDYKYASLGAVLFALGTRFIPDKVRSYTAYMFAFPQNVGLFLIFLFVTILIIAKNKKKNLIGPLLLISVPIGLLHRRVFILWILILGAFFIVSLIQKDKKWKIFFFAGLFTVILAAGWYLPPMIKYNSLPSSLDHIYGEEQIREDPDFAEYSTFQLFLRSVLLYPEVDFSFNFISIISYLKWLLFMGGLVIIFMDYKKYPEFALLVILFILPNILSFFKIWGLSILFERMCIEYTLFALIILFAINKFFRKISFPVVCVIGLILFLPFTQGWFFGKGGIYKDESISLVSWEASQFLKTTPQDSVLLTAGHSGFILQPIINREIIISRKGTAGYPYLFVNISEVRMKRDKIFNTNDIEMAERLLDSLNITHIYISDYDKTLYPKGNFEKFLNQTNFKEVFNNGHAIVYEYE